MNESVVEVECDGGVAQVWLNRPEVHNAFDEHLIARLSETLLRLDADSGVRVVVLGGRGKSFCAGADLGWMRRMARFTEEENVRDASALAGMLFILYGMRKPTLARVHGAALAGGTGLVAACDIAMATPNATFGMTEVRIGLIPATISPHVIRAIGARAAQRYFLTAERFAAEEAWRLGLVHEVCAVETLDARIEELCNVLIAGGPESIAASKRLIADVAERPINGELIDETSRRIARARCSLEASQGIEAFFEKRRAPWNSRQE
ncbi:MAG: enoyl-CoA hydratase/isomerase family protein [Panacagrimonas sp.]